jgi:hypothetical protein
LKSSWLLSHKMAASPLRGDALEHKLASIHHIMPSPFFFLRGKNLLVRLAQQALNAQKHALSVQRRAPRALFTLPGGLQDVEADAAAHVDVRVVDRGLEEDFGRGVRVVCREGEGELEGERVVGRVGGAEQGCVPVGEVGCGEGGDAGCGRGHEGHEFGLKAVGERQLLDGVLCGLGDWSHVPFDHIAAGGGCGF